MPSRLFFTLVAILALTLHLAAAEPPPRGFDIKAYGATGDGQTLDTDAINKAIAAATAAGGGTVYFPSGTFLSHSIHLASNIALYLDQGCILQAAPAPENAGDPGYDPAEPNPDAANYQDFGHTHWHNSLIWGDGIQNISILGPGQIYGPGLLRNGGERAGQGNKAISLKNCRNVTLRDFTMRQCGWFALLATGVDNFTLDNIKVDTNRDGFDIDCCRNVHVSNCSVNSPADDAIVLKSSFGLGFARACENITITNCQVSGFDVGSFLDGTYLATGRGATGRIKFGTESNGGFKNIAISNCVFVHCQGLALESVDGGLIEDVSIDNITMRDIVSAPIFIRLGSRMRGPEGVPVGSIRRVNISNIVVSNSSPSLGCIISGVPDHPIEDVRLSNIRIVYRGGGTKEQADMDPPERENIYPEPSMFGTMPSYGLFARHVNHLSLDHVEVSYENEDLRAPFVLVDVNGAAFEHVKAQRADAVPFFQLWQVKDFSTESVSGVANMKQVAAEEASF